MMRIRKQNSNIKMTRKQTNDMKMKIHKEAEMV